ncbi:MULTISPECIES: GNAT family N-acetyltransferase [Chryseobacterium]|uniref:Ribosomal protein S18 acetylase RimI-like enzyme n=1 Tax=Chryseobacterium camelliae TaxID=1265445 RepID=A0ABU0TKL6_9FLAO|nr:MULTISPECIES: GNAT family N-acetyltransferase [Chryseobacterium]MDT3408559.1 ribosomal protein S18 acetylase RimI-like enzyme [Pseudacidovorax intermedius]MDQ1097586.1 ribosomal protein S18 acetylase RimI-like enzyme [Chryseobacterium camelliae]MDQ1101515.1 ribosomal protein S18 acetylase RimI-like enzyme [Chryseobacterium sp. SORGH_AS_1048]MDR6084958.1 ribosomal protein S18 acetylase RimI-like enzyme [Chryseobacterium sp. SORGH_AS_0909]MDR6129311.1 ribosomal protein S18 acetylase RimI-like
MKIERLAALTVEQFESLGNDGYTSDQKFVLTTTREIHSFSFSLSLTDLNETYIKDYGTTPEDIEEYNEIILKGDSFGAYDNEELAGMAICEEQHWNSSLHLCNLLVSEKQRQKGIGTLLMAKVIRHARDKNCRIIDLETQNTNVPAIRFYLKQGFRITGLRTDVYDDGITEEAIFMTLRV